MKTFPMPAQFDGAKFAARYALTPFDFFSDGTFLYVPDNFSDDPPIFDAPDAPEVVSRNFAASLVDSPLPSSKVLRAIVSIVLDEFNLHALKLNAILDAVDAATTLPDLKTRVGLITDHPSRTMAQLINSIKAKINTGSVD